MVCLAICYVDDFLLTHNSKFDRQPVLKLFSWGSQDELTLDNNLEFKGKEIRLKFDEARSEYYLSFTQTKFIEALEVPKIKGKGEETLQPADLPDYRSVSGSLQWVSGQTRPDVAATISLCSKGSKATYKDLGLMCDAIKFLKATKSEGFNMYPTTIDGNTIVVSYADSSWANAEGFASQHGSLVLFTDARVTEQVRLGTLVDWKSGRSTRVCRSTLAAEAVAADASVDRSVYLNYMLSELLQRKPAFQISTEDLLRSLHVTDCKSLYDCISAMNPNTSEKRVIIDVRSIQQHVGRQEIHWVPTDLMFCDCLTKISKALMTTFQQWLQQPWIQLRKSTS